MIIFISVLYLILGFAALIKGADILIENSVKLAKRFRLSPIVIGVLIVSIGTSIPELIVIIVASIKPGNSSLIMGNVIGSNIANIFFVLGIMGIFLRIPIEKKSLKNLLLANLIVILFLMAVSFISFNDFSFSNAFSNENFEISRGESFFLLIFFFVFLFKLLSNKKNNSESESSVEEENVKIFFPSILIVFSVILLAWGGNQVVDEAVFLAKEVFHLSEGFVGLTIIAIGTSLPEVITSLLAGKKNQTDLALGNILGSNLFNILWVLALAGLIQPLKFESYFFYDFATSFISILLLIILIFIFKLKKFSTLYGTIFIVIYASYLVYLFYRG